MSENINFIPANNLPVAEGDEVSVLCVEGGELKQKPASGLGGGNYDIVVEARITGVVDGMITTECNLVKGTHANAMEKLNNNEIVQVKVIENCMEMPDILVDDGFSPYKAVMSCSGVSAVQNGDETGITWWGIMMNFVLLGDNTILAFVN